MLYKNTLVAVYFYVAGWRIRTIRSGKDKKYSLRRTMIAITLFAV